MPAQDLALGAAASLFVVLPVGYLLRRFPAPATPLAAQLVAGAAYGSALLVTALVPLDMFWLYPQSNDGGKGSRAASQARDALAIAWNLAYWTAVGATVVLPLVQAYFASYEWTALGRLRAAAHATARFYALAAAAGAVGVCALLVSGRLGNPTALLGIAAAAGNVYGMLGVIVLLSFGIVDIPRSWWRSAAVSRRLTATTRDAGRHASEAAAAAAELCRAVAVARATAALLPRRSSAQQRSMVSQLLAEVSDSANAAHDAAPLAARDAAADSAIMDEAEQYIDDAAELARLRGRVHEAAAAFQRANSAYALAVARGLRAMDDDAAIACDGALPAWAPSATRVRTCCGVLRCRRRHFASSSSPLATTPSGASEARWYWRCMLLPLLRRSLAALLAAVSVLVILAEASTFATPGSAGLSDLSAFSRLLRGPLAHHAFARSLLSAAVLGYLTAAVFYTVFALGAFPTFSLTPHASDAPSLLAGAALLCRFAPPLVLNFFSFTHAEDPSADAQRFAHTVFYEQIGRKLDAVPLLGAHAAAGFPIVLLLFVALLAVNAFDRALRVCRWKGSDDGQADAAAAQRGRELLQREEANVRAGLDPGLALLAPAAPAATGPPAEQAAAPPSGAVMEALHRHSVRTGAPPRWSPRPLPPPLPPATGVPLLARLRQSAAAARARVASAFRADEGQQQLELAAAEDAAPLLDSPARTSSTGALLDAVFERIERGRHSNAK